MLAEVAGAEVARRARQQDLDRNEFAGMGDSKYTGVQCGKYVRVVLSGIPAEFVLNFDPRLPILLGGPLPRVPAEAAKFLCSCLLYLL